MQLPDFKELYKPYEGIATLEEMIGHVLKECRNKGIPDEVANKAINFTFLEIADGKVFPTDGGDTGFDNVPHAILNLFILELAKKYHDKSVTAYLEATQGTLQARIQAHVRRSKRKEYANHLKKNSPILKLFIKKEDNPWIS